MLFGLVACDWIAQRELKPGVSTVDDVRKLMGKPEMVWEEKDGSQTLEFVRAPAGTETWMVEIGPDGKYRGMKNALTLENLAQVRPGMTSDDVRRLLGKPSERTQFKQKQEDVWSWRHVDAMKQQRLFNVHLNPDGRVTGTSTSDDPQQPFKGG